MAGRHRLMWANRLAKRMRIEDKSVGGEKRYV